MDPTPQRELGELRRRALLAEADERRRAALIPSRYLRMRAGRLFLALGTSLTEISAEKTQPRLADSFPTSRIRCTGVLSHSMLPAACHAHVVRRHHAD